MQLLQQELEYGREEHEQWLRGPGKEELCEAYRNMFGRNLAADEEAFEREVQAQLWAFDTCASPACFMLFATLWILCGLQSTATRAVTLSHDC